MKPSKDKEDIEQDEKKNRTQRKTSFTSSLTHDHMHKAFRNIQLVLVEPNVFFLFKIEEKEIVNNEQNINSFQNEKKKLIK